MGLQFAVQSIKGPSPTEPVTILYCLIWARFPIYIPQEQGGPVIPLGTGFLYVASYDSQGYGGGILTRLYKGSSVPFIQYKL
jgi:hypothetical protein